MGNAKFTTTTTIATRNTCDADAEAERSIIRLMQWDHETPLVLVYRGAQLREVAEA